VTKVLTQEFHNFSDIHADLLKNIPALNQILDKILEKDPESRYQSGNELAVALHSCLKNIKKK